MIQMDKNSLVTILGNLLKTLGLILLFVLSFPFSLLFWPIKSVVSKLSQPAPLVAHALVPAVVIPDGQLGPESTLQVMHPAESLESSPTISPDQPDATINSDTTTRDDAIKFGNRR